jgi:hypothetical protein
MVGHWVTSWINLVYTRDGDVSLQDCIAQASLVAGVDGTDIFTHELDFTAKYGYDIIKSVIENPTIHKFCH